MSTLADITPGSHYVRADISNADDCSRLVAEVLERFGRLDILVNNAGTTKLIPHADLDAASVDVWREIFEVNVFGTWQLSVAAMTALRESRGSIVNVSSVAGLRPTGSSIPYAASKAALNHMTVLLAKVVGPEVRVNAVAPGLIDTPWTKDWEAVRSYVRAHRAIASQWHARRRRRRDRGPRFVSLRDRSGGRGRWRIDDRHVRWWRHNDAHETTDHARCGTHDESISPSARANTQEVLGVGG